MIERLIRALKDPVRIISYLKCKGFFNFLSDKAYIKLEYFIVFRKKLNLDNPQTFNEKLQWLKLYDRNPLYTTLVDKYAVKEYIKNAIGKEFIIPTIGVWDRYEDIDFDKLPNQFVLKTTHDSGTYIICRDKQHFDKESAKELLVKRLKRNYYKEHREWPYKNVKPRIIAEKYMVDESGTELKDYKFFCFDGEVKAMFIARDRAIGETKFDYYDEHFNRLPIKQHYPNSIKDMEKPKSFEKMKELASLLSKDYPHVRVDFYEINGKIYFGEMTFFHFSGTRRFEPEEWDNILGKWIDLSKAYKYKTH